MKIIKKQKINLLYPYKFNDFIFIDDVVDFIKKSIKLKKMEYLM